MKDLSNPIKENEAEEKSSKKELPSCSSEDSSKNSRQSSSRMNDGLMEHSTNPYLYGPSTSQACSHSPVVIDVECEDLEVIPVVDLTDQNTSGGHSPKKRKHSSPYPVDFNKDDILKQSDKGYEWCKSKFEFFLDMFPHIDENYLADRISNCCNDAAIDDLLTEFLSMQSEFDSLESKRVLQEEPPLMPMDIADRVTEKNERSGDQNTSTSISSNHSSQYDNHSGENRMLVSASKKKRKKSDRERKGNAHINDHPGFRQHTHEAPETVKSIYESSCNDERDEKPVLPDPSPINHEVTHRPLKIFNVNVPEILEVAFSPKSQEMPLVPPTISRFLSAGPSNNAKPLVPGPSDTGMIPVSKPLNRETMPLPGPSNTERIPLPGPAVRDRMYQPGPSVRERTPLPGPVVRDRMYQPGLSNRERMHLPGPSNRERTPMPGPSNKEQITMPGPSNMERIPLPGSSNMENTPFRRSSNREDEPLLGSSKRKKNPERASFKRSKNIPPKDVHSVALPGSATNFVSDTPTHDNSRLSDHQEFFSDEEMEDSLPDIKIDSEVVNEQIQLVTSMLPDADPEYLAEKVTDLRGNSVEFERLVQEWTEKKDYPSRKEYEQRQEIIRRQEKYLSGMTLDKFLQEFPEPESMFNEITSRVSEEYITCCRKELLQLFPYYHHKTVEQALKEKNYHFLPTYRYLKGAENIPLRKSKRYKSKTEVRNWTDERFMKERCYVILDEQIQIHLADKALKRNQEYAKAKQEGTLVMCNCCFEEENLISETSTCSNDGSPHRFCNTCIRRFAETGIGEGKLKFPCIEGECSEEFPSYVLKKVLPKSVYEKLLSRQQAQEIADAGLEDLENCPFCNFAAIMPNKDDKVFSCKAPNCMKESCRLCKEVSHIPLSCDEMKKDRTRTYMEMEMSKAIMRECYKCKKLFVKEDGCNKMTCSCGARMCYVCKEPINSYDHFDSDGFGTQANKASKKCPLWSNTQALHAEELKQKADELKTQAGPNADLSYDPSTDVPEIPKDPNPSQVAAQRFHDQRRRILDPLMDHMPRVAGVNLRAPWIPHQPFFGDLGLNYDEIVNFHQRYLQNPFRQDFRRRNAELLRRNAELMRRNAELRRQNPLLNPPPP